MTPSNRELAEKIFRGMNFPAFQDRIDEIEKLLDQQAKAVRENTIKECADIADRYVKDPYTSDTGTECENLRNNILKLIEKEE